MRWLLSNTILFDLDIDLSYIKLVLYFFAKMGILSSPDFVIIKRRICNSFSKNESPVHSL